MRRIVFLSLLIVTLLVSGLSAQPAALADGAPHEFQRLDRLPGGPGGQVGAQTIFPPDDRVRVTPTTDVPWRRVVQLIAVDSLGNPLWTCSGSFVGPKVVLTAAHCIYNYGGIGWPYAIAIVPGLDGSVAPFGLDWAAYGQAPVEWSSSGNLNFDWAILVLGSPSLGDTVGSMTIGVLSTATLSRADFNPTTAGYPGDKEFGTQWRVATSQFTNVTTTHLLSLLDAYPGQSGSPIWRGSDQKVVGVFSYETGDHNGAIRLTQSIVTRLLSWCQPPGCTFSYEVESPVDYQFRVYVPRIFRNASSP